MRGAGARELVRLLTMIAGVAIALTAFLFGLAAPRAIGSAQSVASARFAVSATENTGSASRLHLQSSDQMVGDRQWNRNLVWVPKNVQSPLPPGVTRWPAPGQSLVSPALAKLINAGSGAKLGVKSYVGIIGSAGIQNPDELVSYTVQKPLPTYSDPGISSFGQSGAARSGMSPSFLYMEMLLLVGVSAVAFINIVMRLSLASRQKRFQALVLVGASPRHLATLFAAEMSLIGAIGAGLAFMSYSLLQSEVGRSGLLGISWWPWQGAVDPILATSVLTGFLLFVWGVAKRRMQVNLTPTRERTPSRLFFLFPALSGALFAMGVTGLVFTVIQGLTTPTREPRTDTGALIVAGLIASTVMGYLGISSLITRWVATVCAKLIPGAPVRLGMRSAAFRASQVGRLLAFVSLAVMAAGVSTGFLHGMERNGTGDPGRAVIRFSLDQVPATQRSRILSLPVVPHAYSVTTSQGQTVMVGNCEGVNAFQQDVFQHPGACFEGQIQRGNGGMGSKNITSVQLSPRSAMIPVPVSAIVPKVMYDVKLPAQDERQAAQAQNGEVDFIASRTNGSYDRLLNAIHGSLPTVQVDSGLKDPEAYANYQQQVAATRTGITAALILATLSMLLSCAELRWASERSRNALAAIGASTRTLRVANLVQFATPTIVGGALATVVAIFSGWCVASFWGSANMFTLQVPVFAGSLYVLSVVIAVFAGWLTGRGEYRRDLMVTE